MGNPRGFDRKVRFEGGNLDVGVALQPRLIVVAADVGRIIGGNPLVEVLNTFVCSVREQYLLVGGEALAGVGRAVDADALRLAPGEQTRRRAGYARSEFC